MRQPDMAKKTFPETFYEHPLQKHHESAAKWALGQKVHGMTVRDLAGQVQRAMLADPKLTQHQAIADVLEAERVRLESSIGVSAAEHRAQVAWKLELLVAKLRADGLV